MFHQQLITTTKRYLPFQHFFNSNNSILNTLNKIPFHRTNSTNFVTKPTVEVLRPGLVVVRNALTIPDQLTLTQHCTSLGLRDTPYGFFDSNEQPNSRSYRGRIYSSISEYPTPLVKDVQLLSEIGHEIDSTLPLTIPTHVLLLCYMNSEGVGWHRDIYENDGEANKPVITLNLGNSCSFIFKDDHTTPKTHIRLESGDVMLFGGECRHAMHKVDQVYENTCPMELRESINLILKRAKKNDRTKTVASVSEIGAKIEGMNGEYWGEIVEEVGAEEGRSWSLQRWKLDNGTYPKKKTEGILWRVIENVTTLSGDGDGGIGGIGDTGRFSLTFRDAPSVIGREHEFATFKVDEHFNKEDNFKWRSNETASNLIKNQKGQNVKDGNGNGNGVVVEEKVIEDKVF